jgi:hypothetical protein
MRSFRSFLICCLILNTTSPIGADEKKDKDDGYVPMFNGTDLSGWVNVNCHRSTFVVKDKMIITTGKPTGYLRTDKQYENFIAEFDWFHVNVKEVGNSGFFVWADAIPATGTGYTRGIEVQVLVNFETDWATSQGDLFSIWGATCKPDRPHPKGYPRCLPSENRCKGGGEWNHYKVIANNGTIKLHVNGKEVSGLSECKPRKGYLALESEGAECRFRNLKIKELPSTNPKASEVADADKGFKSVYTGIDLENFETDPGHLGHWIPRDSVLHYDGRSETESRSLYLSHKYSNYEMIADWKLPATKGKDPKRSCGLLLCETDEYLLTFNMRTDGRLILMESLGEQSEFLADKNIKELRPIGQWNRTLITIKNGKLNVAINGKMVLENIAVTLPKKGEVALMDYGHEIDFANIFIRELK